jgi:AcrR family transcriptional regulator
MSEIFAPSGRRRRADARRSAAAVLDAATTLLGRHPSASMEEIAAAAGVTRQTVYAHFASREALLAAVVDRITAEAVALLESLDLDRGSAGSALARWLDAGWSLMEQYPILLSGAVPAGAPGQEARQHEPVTGGLLRLIRRGSPAWLVAATIALGHAAGAQVAAGHMSRHLAGAAFRDSVLRVYGVHAPGPARGAGMRR